MKGRRFALSFLWLILTARCAYAADINSVYAFVPGDLIIGSSDTSIITQTINLSTPEWVYVESDGRFFPWSGNASASVWITIDGLIESNTSINDWTASTNPMQHSYNAIGAVFLSAGQHVVVLHGKSTNTASFKIGAQSNLSILINPSKIVTTASLGANSNTLNFDTSGLSSTSILPTIPQATVNIDGSNGLPVVALSSARNYLWGPAGDPLTTVTLDGSTLPNNEASWSDNDTFVGAETQAPFFTHAFIPSLTPTIHSLSLSTTEFPYAGNVVQYRMAGDARIVALQGMTVAGYAAAKSDAYNVANYVCIATSTGYGGCPNVGSQVIIAIGDIVIPKGHNGVVLITANTRIQGDDADAGGTVSLFFTIDGVEKGSYGIQQLGSPNGASTRTMSASFLTTGSDALTPGTHRVVLYGQATGNFLHLCMTEDLPIVWFD